MTIHTRARPGLLIRGLVAGFAFLAMIQTAAAQDALRPMTTDEIIEALDPSDEALNMPSTTRNLRVRKTARRAVELTIFFETNSSRVTRRSMVQLEPLGRALRSPRLKGRSFVIIGHTDGVGSRAANRKLSLLRARSVRAYLVDAYDVKRSRLFVRGMGSDEPRDAYNAGAEINRRVEVAIARPAA